MKVRLTRALLLSVLAFGPGSSQAVPAHEHGVAALDLAVDGPTLSIAFESPLDSLVGFEHAPKNDRQRGALARMESDLKSGERLFRPSPDAACSLVAAAVDPPFPGGKAPAGGDAHAEAAARWTFSCTRPEALRAIEVRLFEAFAGIRRIKVQVVTPRGQSGTVLTPARRTLAW